MLGSSLVIISCPPDAASIAEVSDVSTYHTVSSKGANVAPAQLAGGFALGEQLHVWFRWWLYVLVVARAALCGCVLCGVWL